MERKSELLFGELQQTLQSLTIIQKTTTKFGDEIPGSYRETLTNLSQTFKDKATELKSIILEPTIEIDSKQIFDLQTSFEEIYFDLIARTAQAPQLETKPSIVHTQAMPSYLNLPRLTIKHFSGDYLNWIDFKSLFESSVHISDVYTPAQKLQILRSHLEGHALQLINTVPISDDNYAVAYKILCDKYDNVRSAANYHYSRMANFKPSENDQTTVKEFSSIFRASINALQSLKLDMKDFLLFKLAFHVLPQHLRLDFERQCKSDALPTIEQLLDFTNCLEKSFETAKYDSDSQASASSANRFTSDRPRQSFTRKSNAFLLETQRFTAARAAGNPNSYKYHCSFCGSEIHNIYTCTDFLLLSIDNRYKEIIKLKLCQSCFGTHKQSDCKSTKTCKVCHSNKHNTLLHNYEQSNQSNVGIAYTHNRTFVPHCHDCLSHAALTQSSISAPHCVDANCYPSLKSAITPSVKAAPTAHAPISSKDDSAIINNFVAPMADNNVTNLSCKLGNQNVLLGTSIVELLDSHNHKIRCRAVLDTGSETTIITNKMVKRLGLKIKPTVNDIVGISSATASVKGQVQLDLYSPKSPSFHVDCEALIVTNIVGNLPSSCIPSEIADSFNHDDLADPNFMHASAVDLLLGADVYSELLVSSPTTFTKGTPSTISTVFGLVVFGKIVHINSKRSTNALLATADTINNTLQQFWEIEEISLPKAAHPDDDLCEKLYQTTTSRDSTGRYVVALPFKPDALPLGTNYHVALKNYNRLEARQLKDPVLQERYHAFMKEYIQLHHMSITLNSSSYIIPHHCVLKESSTTTKLRTVFNASHLDNRGQSLNGQLLPGPKLQQDICTILTAFRMHKFVICADIKMMYRQILVRPEDRKYQHIFYRKNLDDPVQEFELNTVTYGLTPSAYLAQRTLIQLAEDEGSKFPTAAFALRRHTYVDDILTGANNLHSAERLIQDLISLLKQGGFELRKWSSNEPSLLIQFPQDFLENPHSFSDDSPAVKILGLQWVPKTDCFSYHVINFISKPTKRNILSFIARMFDPLGLLSPVIFWAKYFLQQIWHEKIDWDTVLPAHLLSGWNEYIAQFSELTKINIPRFIGNPEPESHIQLIGFCDASERGYAAVLYLRLIVANEARISLLKAKTRVAPVKTLTIPRLELCAALLLARLYESVTDALSQVQHLDVNLYTDAQIVLAWLHTPPHRLQVFVSNRIRQILSITPVSMWNYIKSEHNPADIASRGCHPHVLVNHSLWWNGPTFLCQSPQYWPSYVHAPIDSLPELRAEKPICFASNITNYLLEVMQKCSSYNRLLRIVAYILRFVHNSRYPADKITTFLTASEIKSAKFLCIKITQQHHFTKEIKQLKNLQPVSVGLRAITPKLDTTWGVLRAGGRLENSSLPEDAIHPIILPKKSYFTDLVCRHFHQIALHGGPRITQALINQEYWIPGLRALIRWKIHNCPRCIRHQGKPAVPIMSSLPSHRVSALRPFQSIGLDYAGPFNLKTSLLRNAPSVKAYICIFVCTSTKAAHLECVSDLTADAFLAAFDRFTSRRGLPLDVYSDNGTNFVGASGLLQEFFAMLNASQQRISSHLSQRSIKWHFNPPYAPNFGGLWEAAVKSTKLHLFRVLNKQLLTYEEFATLLARIEAVLNSRPLFEPSPDPNESNLTLTPGHFLIGTSMLQPPEEKVTERLSHRSRWTLLRYVFQNFWNVWSKHYLHTLIQRSKWNKPTDNFQVNQLVIMYGVNTSPADWPLAKIIAVHPSKDGIVRVVTVKTSAGTYTRPANRLILVPTGTDNL